MYYMDCAIIIGWYYDLSLNILIFGIAVILYDSSGKLFFSYDS